jgi:DNA-binding NtrC family response regulator
MSGAVLLVEDDPVLGASLAQRLRLEGYAPRWARSAAEAEAALRTGRYVLCLCDMRLPDGSGEEVLRRLLPEIGALPLIAMTAYGSVEQAVRLMRLGADDYVAKPFAVQALMDRVRTLAAPPPQRGEAGAAGWRSAPMQALAAAIGRIAGAEAPVLITGESGAGKEVAARRLHAAGRGGAPFLLFDCAATAEAMLEAELFGVAEGAAPGLAARAGAAERAGDGTLLLDEIAELGAAGQARLLRLVETRRFAPMGEAAERALGARLVFATHADLDRAVAEGRFRPELRHRMGHVVLEVPPLRARPDDLAELAALFLAEAAARTGREAAVFSPAAEAALGAHGWPGNVRELRNRIERAVLFAPAGEIGADALFPDRAAAEAPADLTLAAARDAAERAHIRRVLARCEGAVGEAARALGVSRTTLWERMRKLGLGG